MLLPQMPALLLLLFCVHVALSLGRKDASLHALHSTGGVVSPDVEKFIFDALQSMQSPEHPWSPIYASVYLEVEKSRKIDDQGLAKVLSLDPVLNKVYSEQQSLDLFQIYKAIAGIFNKDGVSPQNFKVSTSKPKLSSDGKYHPIFHLETITFYPPNFVVLTKENDVRSVSSSSSAANSRQKVQTLPGNDQTSEDQSHKFQIEAQSMDMTKNPRERLRDFLVSDLVEWAKGTVVFVLRPQILQACRSALGAPLSASNAGTLARHLSNDNLLLETFQIKSKVEPLDILNAIQRISERKNSVAFSDPRSSSSSSASGKDLNNPVPPPKKTKSGGDQPTEEKRLTFDVIEKTSNEVPPSERILPMSSIQFDNDGPPVSSSGRKRKGNPSLSGADKTIG